MNDPYGSDPYPSDYPPQPAGPREAWVRVSFASRKPLVTYTLMGITIFMFILQAASQAFLEGNDWPFYLGGKINEFILNGEFWRLLTPMFLHGSLLHIGFNMYALYALGPSLERYYGHVRFLLLYLIAGFAGNVVSFLFTPAPSIGASTAIFGLIAAEGVLLYRNRDLFGPKAQQALINIVMIAGVNLVIGLSPGIDNWGHIGGLLGGLMFAWFAGPDLKVQGLYPSLELVDERETRSVALVTLGVFFLFLFLVLVQFMTGFFPGS